MPRPRTPIGTHGSISYHQRRDKAPGDGPDERTGRVIEWRAKTRFRDYDGGTRVVTARAATKTAAETKIRRKLHDLSAPSREEISSGMRLAALAEAWLAEIRADGRTPSTVAQYERHARVHVTPGVGDLLIREATTPVLNRFVQRVRERSGDATARLCRVVLNGMFSLAVRHGASLANPVAGTRAVTPKSRPVRALADADVQLLRARLAADEAARRADLPDLFEFLLGTGCRPGEALAVRWSDVDLAAEVPTLRVTGTVVRVAGRLTLQEHTKTEAGMRVLVLPPFVVATLLARIADDPRPNPLGLVFASTTGTIRDPHATRRAWRDFRAKVHGYDWVELRSLRSTVATLVGRSTDARTAADQLGHAGTGVTEKHYIERVRRGPDVRDVLEGFGRG